MSDDVPVPVTLEFLGRQQERILAEMRAEFRAMRTEISSFRDDMRVMTAIVLRMEGTQSAHLEEVRAIVAQQQGHGRQLVGLDERLRGLEDER